MKFTTVLRCDVSAGATTIRRRMRVGVVRKGSHERLSVKINSFYAFDLCEIAIAEIKPAFNKIMTL